MMYHSCTIEPRFNLPIPIHPILKCVSKLAGPLYWFIFRRKPLKCLGHLSFFFNLVPPPCHFSPSIWAFRTNVVSLKEQKPRKGQSCDPTNHPGNFAKHLSLFSLLQVILCKETWRFLYNFDAIYNFLFKIIGTQQAHIGADSIILNKSIILVNLFIISLKRF